MYLESIEINGFKSFPDKTRLNFKKGITAVVGPNGSGKSNIADAVRWVLGEQSVKSLRSQKMEDVIFNGTEKRGATGIASVSLVINNADKTVKSADEQIEISRKYYRSGESAYSINGTVSRLKDVHELFYDTGLGRDGYSMIGQGKIDEIISSKSTERREIFETAAGISKYRHRKTEAQRKLQSISENLVRIKDIFLEVENRIEPLFIQSKKAEKFIELDRQKSEIEVGLWLDIINKSSDKFDGIRAKIKIAQDDFVASNSQLENIDLATKNLEELNVELTEKIEQNRENIAKILDVNTEIKSQIAVFKNDIEHNVQDIEKLNSNLTSATENRENREKLLENLHHDLDTKQVKVKKFFEKIEQTKQKLNKLNELFASETDDEKSLSLNEIIAKLADLKTRLATAQNTKKININRITTLNSDMLTQEKSQKDLQGEQEKAEADVKRLEEKILENENVLKGVEIILLQKQSAHEELKNKCDRLRQQAASALEKAQILQALEDNMEGFSFATKKVLNANFSGVVGVISHLLSCDKEYDLALETALGNSVQNIVVKTENDATVAIKFLKENNFGRATFMPLESIKSRYFTGEKLHDIDGFCAIAVDIVKCESAHENIASHLLGGVIIASDIEAARKIAKKTAYKHRIVTLDGQQISPGGVFTGGSKVRTAGIFSRTKDIKALAERGKSLQNEANNLQKDFANESANISKLNADIIATKSEITTFNEDKTLALAEIRRMDSQSKFLCENIKAMMTEVGKISNETENLTKEILENETALQEFEEKKQKLESEIAKDDEKKTEYNLAREKISQTLTELNIDFMKAEQEKFTLEEKISELNETLSQTTKDDAKILAEIVEISKKNDLCAQKVTACEENLTSNILRMQEFEQSIENLSVKISQNSGQIKTTQDTARENIERRAALKAEIDRLEHRLTTAQTEVDELIAKLFDEYELTLTEVKKTAQIPQNLGEANRTLKSLKNEIRNLGIINVAAIEEYKLVNERHVFMKTQIEDIEQSRTELTKLIADLTGKMQKIFVEKFAQINKNFSAVFAELFGGGKAELSLTNPGEILESGINIAVQPPGKKLAIIEQLSGGEKVLTALAIYFAIMRINPPPFCVMDEVEAALDEANVTRFAQFCKKSTRKTQFITITHRRQTMEEADMLYGVTMQEKGVSKLLVLNPSEMEKILKA